MRDTRIVLYFCEIKFIYKPVRWCLSIMFKEIICAVTVLVALNYVTHHVQRLIEQNVELEEQVLMLTVKVSELRDLNKHLKEQNQAFRYEAASVQRTLDMLSNEAIPLRVYLPFHGNPWSGKLLQPKNRFGPVEIGL